MILIIHDASDIFLAFMRFYCETKGAKDIISSITYIFLLFTWVYMRVVVYPFCLLSNVFTNRPTPSDDWYIISFEYNYLLNMAFVLYGMHLFWTYLIIKSGMKKIGGKKKQWDNIHDKKVKN